jgi:hypothetical protein
MDKKRRIFLAVFSLLLIFATEAEAIFTEKIKNFSVEIWIKKDRSFLVKESIVYDFNKNLRHGIYRKIPRDDLRIEVEKVIDETGKAYPVKITKEGKYLNIKIGNPQKLVTGEKVYNIFYRVQNGIGFFENYDEIYWNVTGDEWEVSIEKASAILHLPEEIPQEDLKLDCFAGAHGSREKDCTFKVKTERGVVFQTTRELLPREGLTIVLGFPKGILKEPNFFLRFVWKVEKFLPFLIPVLIFLFLFEEWWRKGRDPRIKRAIVPRYEIPDNLKPAQVALILKQKIEPRDISATLIDLAVRGFIKIKEIKREIIFGFENKDYELEKLKSSENILEYEKLLLERIFKGGNKIKISSLENKFFRDFQTIVKKICQAMTRKKYFVENPQKIKNKWVILGFLVIILGWAIGVFTRNFPLLISFLLFYFLFSLLLCQRGQKKGQKLFGIF